MCKCNIQHKIQDDISTLESDFSGSTDYCTQKKLNNKQFCYVTRNKPHVSLDLTRLSSRYSNLIIVNLCLISDFFHGTCTDLLCLLIPKLEYSCLLNLSLDLNLSLSSVNLKLHNLPDS